MSSSVVIQNKVSTGKTSHSISLNWADNPDIRDLLDIISAIIAEEYIEIARKNKGVFEIASVASLSRNDIKQNGDNR